LSTAAARPGRRGRRPGAPDTRAAILAAAREAFADKGFAGTTIRGVAATAGVDAALVHHYFGAKDDLFVAAMQLPVDPRTLIAAVAFGDREHTGERLVRTFLSVWDDPDQQPVFVGLLRNALEPGGHRLLTEGFVPIVIGGALESMDLDRPELRIPLLASQMIGLIMCRYLLELEPIASMSADAVVAAYAPTVQRYLTGEVD
jgi:AcrR family transcriptional regulator